MLKTLRAASCAAVLFGIGLAAIPAHAIVFTFGAGSNTANTVTLSEGGLDLTVKGFTGFDATAFGASGTLGTAANINRNNAGNGWGVNGGGGGGLIGVGDALNLDFSPNSVVLVSALVFELDGDADQFTLFNGQTAVQAFDLPADPAADTFTLSGLEALLGTANATGDNFTIATNSGAIRLQSLEVNSSSSVAVPLPAPFLMSLAVLAVGFGAVRVKRRA